MSDRPRLTIKQAAEAVGVSARTIRRRLGEGAFPGAYKDGSDTLAPWLIPVEDLEAAGLAPNRSRPQRAEVVDQVRPSLQSLEVEQLRAELVQLRHRAERAEDRAEYSERLAAEVVRRAESLEASLRANESALRTTESALLALTAGPAPQADEPKQRRRWRNR